MGLGLGLATDALCMTGSLLLYVALISYCLNQTSFYIWLQDGKSLLCNANLLLRLMFKSHYIFQDYPGIFGS